ncbi:enhanced intracellular survival protein Eis [Bacillus daqingensis]|uniref:Enhanced intracellular survival protein Eis n=1 Tax=Bacillus daqingensis TaxID=872396 RepID=A0ABV9NSN5_9BACI
MEIRRLKSSEAEHAVKMSEFAFQYELTEEQRRARLADMNPQETWVIEENGEMLSKAAVLPMDIYFYDMSIPAGGVSGVATWPEERRKGHVGKLLYHSLQQMRKEGRLLSLLYPFSIPFYRRFGWELYADQETCVLKREQFPLFEPSEGKVSRITPDAQKIGPVYDRWAANINGSVVRSAEWWRKNTFKRKPGTCAVYTRGDDIFGYMIYEMKDRKMTVHEIIWLDPDARRGLMGYIRNHDSMADTVSITGRAHDMMPFLLPDPKVERNVASYFMARIVSCEPLLSLLPLELKTNESVMLHVSDEFCPWNDGTYILSADSGPPSRVRFFPPRNEEDRSLRQLSKKGIKLDINMLSAIIMGAQKPVRLWEEGMIEGEEDMVRLLQRALPDYPPFIYDFF